MIFVRRGRQKLFRGKQFAGCDGGGFRGFYRA
jgi:hypothetical protein